MSTTADTTSEVEPYKPPVPAVLRTVVYYTQVIVGFLALVALSVFVPLFPTHAVPITVVALGISAPIGWLCGLLGVKFNPVTHPVGPPVGQLSTEGNAQ